MESRTAGKTVKAVAIKAVIFDIDDTLFASTEFAEKARRNAVNAMVEAGLKADTRKAYSELSKIIAERGSNYGNHFGELCKKFRHSSDKDKIVAAGIAAYHNTKASILPFPEVPRALLKLRDEGYALYVASEGNSLKQWDKLFRLGVYLMFDEVFVSKKKEPM